MRKAVTNLKAKPSTQYMFPVWDDCLKAQMVGKINNVVVVPKFKDNTCISAARVTGRCGECNKVMMCELNEGLLGKIDVYKARLVFYTQVKRKLKQNYEADVVILENLEAKVNEIKGSMAMQLEHAKSGVHKDSQETHWEHDGHVSCNGDAF